MSNKGVLWSGLIFLFLLAGQGYAQGGPPACAELMSIPPYVGGGELWVKIDHSLCPVPDGDAWYQFQRLSISPGYGNDSTSIWVVSSYDSMLFIGVGDGEVVAYRARVATPTDTSDWSTPYEVMHDLDPPSVCPYVMTAWCASESKVRITWSRAFDNASGVVEYKIYRTTNAGALYNITAADDVFIIASVSDHGEETFTYYDELLTSGAVYYYAVVPYDRVGHYPQMGNTVSREETYGADDCVGMPPCAILRPIPRYTESETLTVRIDGSLCGVVPDRQYRYKIVDITDSDSIITDWLLATSYTFDIEECHTYFLHAQAKDPGSALVSSWSHSYPGGERITTCDRYGPESVDTAWATALSGSIRFDFVVSDEAALDCGSGLMQYNVYRITEDSLTAHPDIFMRLGTVGASYLLYTFDVDSYRTDAHYSLEDDGPTDPVIDLQDRVRYYYFVATVDSLGHIQSVPYPIDTATADKGVVPPMLIDLSDWHGGDSITISIVDTSHCDITQIFVEYTLYRYSSSDWITLGPYQIHDPLFHNPDDGDCSDIDTLTLHITGLDENHYFFRAFAYDSVGNLSLSSNIVHTTFDNSPPSAVLIDSLVSYADSTDKIRVKLVWSGSYDAGVGLVGYRIYRSSAAGVLGSMLADLPWYQTEWIDESPDPTNYWHNNYYTVMPYDDFGFANEGGTQVSFADGETPPYVPVIDTVYMRRVGTDIRIRINWSDTTPSHYGMPLVNTYRVEHSADISWLWSGDPILVQAEAPVAGNTLELPYTALAGAPVRYFQIVAIDAWGNESGYSQIYEFHREFEEDSIWVHLNAGWNFFSLPVYPRSYDVDYLLPGIADLYAWSGSGWFTPDEIHPGDGYVVSTSHDIDLRFVGMPVEQVIVPIEWRGWHLVGAPFTISDYGTTGDLRSGPWGYDRGTYFPTDSTNPGSAYWVLYADTLGAFYSPTVTGGKARVREPSDVYTIQIDGQNFYLGVCRDGRGLDMPMPPAAPGQSVKGYIESSDGTPLIEQFSSVPEWYVRVLVPAELKLPPRLATDNSGDEYAPGLYRVYLKNPAPERFELLGNTPNPFNSLTVIKVALPEDGDVVLRVSDMLGRTVWSTTKHITAGVGELRWNGQDKNGRTLESGIYFYTVRFNDSEHIGRMLYLR